MRPSQQSTHFAFPDGSMAAGTVEVEAMRADTIVELGEFVPKHGPPWLLFLVTEMNRLVLALVLLAVYWFEAASWTRKTVCVLSLLEYGRPSLVVLYCSTLVDPE